jgi:23S rRNA (cytosine1962-C5)-methyltransferase
MDAISANGYELIDFGNGAKLERFGSFTIQRPCPAAERCTAMDPKAWRHVNARYQRSTGGGHCWAVLSPMPDTWLLRLDELTVHLRLTATGQLGIFPEQQMNWRWLARQVRQASRPLRVLNLFAYTGASTLAAAAAGAHVTHLDAARSPVKWAQKNAQTMGIPGEAIDWVVEDARKFVKRAIRRERRYDAVILDPPSYGHGPRQEPWKIQHDLPELLRDCRQLLAEQPAFALVTSHSPGFGKAELQAAVDSFLFQTCTAGSRAASLSLRTANGRELSAGTVVRWPGAKP